MELSRVLPLVVVGAAVALAGCESKEVEPAAGGGGGAPSGTAPSGAAPGGAGSIEGAANQAAGALEGLVKDGKEKAVAAAQQGLDAAKVKFGELKARASAVAAENRPAFDNAVAEIETQLGSVQTQLEELGKAGSDAWQKISADVQAGVTKLTEQINAALAQFGGK